MKCILMCISLYPIASRVVNSYIQEVFFLEFTIYPFQSWFSTPFQYPTLELSQSPRNQSPHAQSVMIKTAPPIGGPSASVPRATSTRASLVPVSKASTIYARRPPPACAPEPAIPVQSVFNGTRENIPAGQLLTPTGQPVFVITRQMKTASGSFFHILLAKFRIDYTVID